MEAISASSYLAYGGAGRGPPYTKYEGPNHAPSGVSGHARPPPPGGQLCALPTGFHAAVVTPAGRAGVPLGGSGRGNSPHVFCMTGTPRGRIKGIASESKL